MKSEGITWLKLPETTFSVISRGKVGNGKVYKPAHNPTYGTFAIFKLQKRYIQAYSHWTYRLDVLVQNTGAK